MFNVMNIVLFIFNKLLLLVYIYIYKGSYGCSLNFLCSIRIFSIAFVICFLLVLPVNYYGKEAIHHMRISSEQMEVFTIENVKEGSRWYVLYIVDD